MPKTPADPQATSRRDDGWRWLVAAVVFGILLAAWPHLVSLRVAGTWEFVADPDERQCYLPAISHAMAVHPWKLGDEALPRGGMSVYPNLQFVPFMLAAKAVGGGPLLVLLLWRLWAGASLGAILFLIGRELLPGPRAAFLLAVLCLADHGFMSGRPVADHLALAARLAHDPSVAANEDWVPYLRQFRLITPGVSWIFLGLFLLMVIRLRRTGAKADLLGAGAALGALFYTYFYFWSAAVPSLVLLAVLDRRHWRQFALVAVVGGLVGLPGVLFNSHVQHTQADGWLERLDFFRRIGRFEELSFPRVMVGLAAGSALVFAWRQRAALPVACLALAGIAMGNHQIVTRLQMQNHHYLAFVGATCTALSVYLVVLGALASKGDLPAGRRAGWAALGVVAAAVVAGAFLIRTVDPLRNLWAVRNRDALARFHRARAGQPPLAPNAVVAGDLDFADFAVVLEAQRSLAGCASMSHSTSNEESERRRILDLVLRGATPDDAAAGADGYYGCHFAAMRRDAAARERLAAARRAMAASMAADPSPWLARYDVRYVAARRGARTPVAALPGWRERPSGEGWQLWERTN